jgi:hypothetical protein
VLEQVAGKKVRLFAYPENVLDLRTAKHVRDLGFVAAFAGDTTPALPADLARMRGRGSECIQPAARISRQKSRARSRATAGTDV